LPRISARQNGNRFALFGLTGMNSLAPASAQADVFSADELAAATGSSRTEIAAWIEAGLIHALPVGDGATWIAAGEAVRAGRAIASGVIAVPLQTAGRDAEPMFEPASATSRALRAPLAVSSSLHAALIAAIVIATTLGLGQAAAVSDSQSLQPEKMRLVYLALPGPGGGGGGGGRAKPMPPPRARRQGTRAISSPVQARPEPPRPVPQPPAVEPEPLPPVEAPVAPVAADVETAPGVVEEVEHEDPSPGPGSEGGTGTGAGTGIGEGDGAGLGEGSGGGTGGGPYRPGSGIEPPALLREVKPDYSEQARRRGVEGDVVMEIVVRHDGSVGDVRVLHGLGHGLDERAVAAVRQWRFTPATRRGAAVDVLVEVAMEFKLR
jgi:TonB family protein